MSALQQARQQFPRAKTCVTKKLLGRSCIKSGLGALQDPRGGAGQCRWARGHLENLAGPVASSSHF